MKKVIITKGLPASGKTTWAKGMVEKEHYKRISKDDLRLMLDNSRWSKENEKIIVSCRNKILIELLQSGVNVIVDDTNFEHKHWEDVKEIVDLHNTFNAKTPKNMYCLEEKFFDADVEDCVKRDLKRTISVGEKVIRGMYDKYLKPKSDCYLPDASLQRAIICDLDGTLALLNGRDPYEPDTVINDELNIPVAEAVKSLLAHGYQVIFMSGRFEKYRNETTEWLSKNGFNEGKLLMRADNDTRRDAIIKRELFDKHVRDYYNVTLVLDDRQQVVDMWRNLGLSVFQVADGKF